MLRWEGWNGDEAESHTANSCESAKGEAGKVEGTFVRAKRLLVIVGSLFEGVKSLLVDTKSLFVEAKSLLVGAKSLLVDLKRFKYIH